MPHELIQAHAEALRSLCSEHGVERLDLFGSAAGDAFDADHSDLDFIVVFADEGLGTLADRYLDLAESLEALFGRRVDLLTERSIRSPLFREAVERTRKTVYERASAQALA